jgi:hypothetical protein
MCIQLLNLFSPAAVVHPLVMQFAQQLERQPLLLFYPSSSCDLSDIYYINTARCPSLPLGTPDVYIHSDLSEFERNHWYYSFSIEDKFYDGENKVVLTRFNMEGRTGWLLNLYGTPNEKMLIFFINNRVKINYLFSCCDGITTGWGRSSEGISTAFYPFLYEVLGVWAHITEYDAGIEFSTEDKEAYKFNIRRLLPLIKNVRRRNRIKQNLEEYSLRTILQQFPEEVISSKDQPRIIGGGHCQVNFVMRQVVV